MRNGNGPAVEVLLRTARSGRPIAAFYVIDPAGTEHKAIASVQVDDNNTYTANIRTTGKPWKMHEDMPRERKASEAINFMKKAAERFLGSGGAMVVVNEPVEDIYHKYF